MSPSWSCRGWTRAPVAGGALAAGVTTACTSGESQGRTRAAQPPSPGRRPPPAGAPRRQARQRSTRVRSPAPRRGTGRGQADSVRWRSVAGARPVGARAPATCTPSQIDVFHAGRARPTAGRRFERTVEGARAVDSSVCRRHAPTRRGGGQLDDHGQPADRRASWLSVSCRSAAAAESTIDAGREAPGIGRTTSACARCQARVTR